MAINDNAISLPVFYILDENGHPKVEPDINAWASWRGRHETNVRVDHIGGVGISTEFLGFNINIFVGPPLVFETMIFGGRHDGYQERYTTRAEAEAGHARALAMVKDTP